MSRALWGSCCVVVVLAAAGCARGGGGDEDPLPGRDGGRLDGGPRVDSGPRVDGGPIGNDDSGPVGNEDSGPSGDDGGPIGTDSGPIGTDSGPIGCTSASECSDGLACNGIERCEGGRCVMGTPMGCDDGVACTTDGCVEPGTCSYTPLDSMCPTGQRCTATGCIPTSTCSESPCRLVAPQCGCAAGQGCYLSGATRACGAAGTGTESAACTSSASCAPGLDCINFSAGTPAQQCTRYCAADADCGGRPGALCLSSVYDSAGNPIAGASTCTTSCNPVTSAGCVAGLGCGVYRENAGARRWVTECAGPVGLGGQDDLCLDDSDCARGHVCDTVNNWCLRWCRVGGSDCTFGYTCYGLDAASPATIGGVTYGVCDI